MSSISTLPSSFHPAEDALTTRRYLAALSRQDDDTAILGALARRMWPTREQWAPPEWELQYPPRFNDKDPDTHPYAPADRHQAGLESVCAVCMFLALTTTGATAPKALSRLPMVTRGALLGALMVITGHDDAPSMRQLGEWSIASSRTMIGAIDLMAALPSAYARALWDYGIRGDDTTKDPTTGSFLHAAITAAVKDAAAGPHPRRRVQGGMPGPRHAFCIPVGPPRRQRRPRGHP